MNFFIVSCIALPIANNATLAKGIGVSSPTVPATTGKLSMVTFWVF